MSIEMAASALNREEFTWVRWVRNSSVFTTIPSKAIFPHFPTRSSIYSCSIWPFCVTRCFFFAFFFFASICQQFFFSSFCSQQHDKSIHNINSFSMRTRSLRSLVEIVEMRWTNAFAHTHARNGVRRYFVIERRLHKLLCQLEISA